MIYKKARLILYVLLIIALFKTTVYADNHWWNSAYKYRKILTFNNSGRAEDLHDFPVLIKLTSSNFDFGKIQTSGQDIRFIDSDGSTQLPYEIEQWDSSGSTAAIWVKIPQIDASSANDFIYLYYGNPSASDGQMTGSVWNNRYLGVWHMSQDPASGNVLDSTGNGYSAIPSGTFTSALNDAKIGKGITFTTSNKLTYNTTDVFKFSANQDFTVSIWTKEDLTNPKTWRPPIGTIWTGSPRIGWWFLTVNGSSTSYFQIENDSLSKNIQVTSDSVNLIDGNWHHLTGVRQGDEARYYIDGNLVSTQSGANFDLSSSSPLTWAWTSNNSPSVKYAGVLDETEISNTARSSAWINAQYSSMTDNLVSYSNEKTETTTIDLSLNNELKGSTNGNYRMYGDVRSSDSQFLPSAVQYQPNGNGWYSATASDGSFDEQNDEYYFDFAPNANNYGGDGFTIRLRTVRGTEVQADNLFYFNPFNPIKPENNAIISGDSPTFSFNINKGRFDDLKDNLSRFSIEINKNNTVWKTYIDSIPVDYEAVKSSDTNYKKTTAETKGNGLYEDKKISVAFSTNNSTIDVYAKAADAAGNPTENLFENGGKKLNDGKYQWRVVAHDKRGHRQETDVRTFQIGSNQIVKNYPFFPLTILSITGAGNLQISTTKPASIKSAYTTWSTAPTFYGIAVVGSTVTLSLTDNGCAKQNKPNCTSTYEAQTNTNSRWGINVPKKIMQYGKNYMIKLSVKLDGDYNELPAFVLKTL